MLIESARILWRLKVWVMLSLVVALGAGAGTFMAIPPKQQDTAQVLFIPSEEQAGITGATNPFLFLSGSVATVASLVQISISDDSTAEQLAAQGDTAKFTVLPNLSENAGPVLIVTTQDRSAAVAQSTLDAVIQTIQRRLRQFQEDQKVRPELMITSMILTSSDRPSVIRKTQIQVSVMALLGVLALMLGMILLGERRRRRRKAKAGSNGRPESVASSPLREREAVPEVESPTREFEPIHDEDTYAAGPRP